MSDEYNANVGFIISRSLDYIEQKRMQHVFIRYCTDDQEITVTITGNEKEEDEH